MERGPLQCLREVIGICSFCLHPSHSLFHVFHAQHSAETTLTTGTRVSSSCYKIQCLIWSSFLNRIEAIFPKELFLTICLQPPRLPHWSWLWTLDSVRHRAHLPCVPSKSWKYRRSSVNTCSKNDPGNLIHCIIYSTSFEVSTSKLAPSAHSLQNTCCLVLNSSSTSDPKQNSWSFTSLSSCSY